MERNQRETDKRDWRTQGNSQELSQRYPRRKPLALFRSKGSERNTLCCVARVVSVMPL